MIVATKTFDRKKYASWLAGLVTLAYIMARFVPCTLPSHYAIKDFIDDDWTQILHVAFARHLQFGRDIVFTYGPWGFLARGYYPPTYPVSVFAWVLLSLVFWRASWKLMEYCSGQLWFSFFWILGLAGFASTPTGDDISGRFVAFAWLLLSLHLVEKDGRFTTTQALLVLSLGCLCLIKFTALLETGLVVMAIAIDTVWRHRRFPWIVPLLAASVILFWMAAGQSLGWLGSFLIRSWELTRGYTEAMMRSSPGNEANIFYFLSIIGLLLALSGYGAWRQYRQRAIPAMAAMCGLMLIVFKQGYVRHDTHEISALTSLAVISLFCLATAWTSKQRWMRLAGFVGVGASVIFSTFVFSRVFPDHGLPAQLLETFYPQRLFAPMRTLFTGDLRNEQEQEFASLRSRLPFSMTDGDVYPYGQTLLVASGVPVRARPVFHGYSAYTPGLADLNASYLRSDRAASNILFRILPLDSRLPSLEDGRSWPELMTLYDLESSRGPFLLLTRAESPRNYRLTLMKEVSAQFGQEVAVPLVTNGLLWAELDIEKSWIGTLVTAIYKPPELAVKLTVSDSRVGQFRVIPGLTRSGFLLSPLVLDTKTFAALIAKDNTADLPALGVTSLTLYARTESGSTVCYQSPIRLRFYQLSIKNASE